jgi:hypothetical protein
MPSIMRVPQRHMAQSVPHGACVSAEPHQRGSVCFCCGCASHSVRPQWNHSVEPLCEPFGTTDCKLLRTYQVITVPLTARATPPSVELSAAFVDFGEVDQYGRADAVVAIKNASELLPITFTVRCCANNVPINLQRLCKTSFAATATHRCLCKWD